MSLLLCMRASCRVLWWLEKAAGTRLFACCCGAEACQVTRGGDSTVLTNVSPQRYGARERTGELAMQRSHFRHSCHSAIASERFP